MGEDAIVISNTGLDDLFECLKNRAISMEDQFGTDAVVFVPNEPDIKFKLEENDDGEYKITVNVDIYAYMVYEGRKYTYLMLDKKLYRCSKKYTTKHKK